MVQLIAKPPWPRYRFRVKLRDLGSQRGVGIYVLGQRQITTEGEEHWFCKYTFTEQERPLPINGKDVNSAEALLRLCRHNRLKDGRTDDPTKDFGNPNMFPGELSALRTLAFEVTQDVVSAYWETMEYSVARVLRTPELTDSSKRLAIKGLFKNPNPPPPAMQGSLGLICERGTSVCEEAVLEPLPD
jgi:hypothetical protein